jgi:hypothetical protein
MFLGEYIVKLLIDFEKGTIVSKKTFSKSGHGNI